MSPGEFGLQSALASCVSLCSRRQFRSEWVLDWPCSLQQTRREPTAKQWHQLPSGRLAMPVSRPSVVAEGEEQCLVQGQDPRDTNTAQPGLWVESRLSLGSQQHRRTPSGKEGRHATSLPRHSLVPPMKSGISFGKKRFHLVSQLLRLEEAAGQLEETAGDVCSHRQKDGLLQCGGAPEGTRASATRLCIQLPQGSGPWWKMKLACQSQANVLHACHAWRERPPPGRVSGAFLSPCAWWVQRGHLSCVAASGSFLLSPKGLTWWKASSPDLAASCLAPSFSPWGGKASASAAACQDGTMKLGKEEALQSSRMGTAF